LKNNLEMPLLYNPKTMPLRKPSGVLQTQTVGGFCCLRKLRCYCFLIIVVVIGTTLCNDRGVHRSLSQPMIRKSANYLKYLADTGDQPMNSEWVGREPKTKNDTPKFVEANITNEKAKDDIDRTIEVDRIDINNAQITKGKKPHLFLHVGPQKTGSSTFQSSLDKLSSLTHELKDDNFHYRHVMPETGDFDCEIGQWGGFHNCKVSEQLKSIIAKARDEGKNLLLTDENLDKNFVIGLRDAIDDDDWDVTVVVMYRRIHEWLLSWYNQINKTTNIDSKGDVLFNDEGIPYRTEHKHWPDHDGIRVPDFSTWYKKYTQYWKPTELVNMHRSIEYYNLYSKLFENVLLYNMHQKGDLVTDFICNIIGATNACERYKNNGVYKEEVNSSVHLDHDIVAVHAYDQGHVDKTLTRKEVTEAVTTYILESGKIIPRKCDSEVIDQIRNWLIDSEKVMLGDHNYSEDELLQIYESYITKGKLCDVDKKAILLDQDWLHFFHSLEERERRNLVLYVGPIGGDTIYETLTTTPIFVEGLKKDNYTVMNIDTNGGHFFDCTQRRGNSPHCVASSNLKSTILSLEESKKNVLISNDDLDERFVEAFKGVIDETKWKLKIVVGYIRLNQLLLMMYENEYNFDNLDPSGHFVIGRNDNPNRVKHSSWPDEGIRIPGFNEWFDVLTQESEVSKIEHLNMHLRDGYLSSFDNVEFYPYHDQADFQKDFVCRILLLRQTCEITKEYGKDASKKSSISTRYTDGDILAVYAYGNGLIKKGLSRQHVADAVRNRIQSTGNVLSRVCPSNDTKKLYDWMVESEKAIFGSRWSSKRIAGINKDFQSFLESGKLCSLDVENEIQNGTWVDFFQSLN